jgi:hypothetical protein
MDFPVIEGPAGETILLEYVEPDRVRETGKRRGINPAARCCGRPQGRAKA